MKITKLQLAQIIRKNTHSIIIHEEEHDRIDFDAAVNQINEMMQPKWATIQEWENQTMNTCSYGMTIAWMEARK